MIQSLNTPRYLCGAFLLQAVASMVSGLFLTPISLLESSAPDDLVDAMESIADNAVRMRASILGEMITAAGVALLGIF